MPEQTTTMLDFKILMTVIYMYRSLIISKSFSLHKIHPEFVVDSVFDITSIMRVGGQLVWGRLRYK